MTAMRPVTASTLAAPEGVHRVRHRSRRWTRHLQPDLRWRRWCTGSQYRLAP